jgi:6-pyruvoyltetrahydropterin/6-carboxytetrahydropterin synthase
MSYELRRRYRIQSAHRLPLVAPEHPCARTHGHTYEIELAVTGTLDDHGWVSDYADIDRAAEPTIAVLDHTLLNDIDGLENPTSEHLARWLWQHLDPLLPGLTAVAVSENPDCSCTYRPDPA